MPIKRFRSKIGLKKGINERQKKRNNPWQPTANYQDIVQKMSAIVRGDEIFINGSAEKFHDSKAKIWIHLPYILTRCVHVVGRKGLVISATYKIGSFNQSQYLNIDIRNITRVEKKGEVVNENTA